VLEDGTYDVLVVDADADGAGSRLDVTVLGGPRKGDVVSIRVSGMAGDPLDLLGLPGTLTVADGEPSIVLDR
jgi:hypothetical protein